VIEETDFDETDLIRKSFMLTQEELNYLDTVNKNNSEALRYIIDESKNKNNKQNIRIFTDRVLTLSSFGLLILTINILFINILIKIACVCFGSFLIGYSCIEVIIWIINSKKA
jgi:hypothetical protein